MKPRLDDYVVPHPTASRKETCRACLEKYEDEKKQLQATVARNSLKKEQEIKHKQGQITRMAWPLGRKSERERHFKTCPRAPAHVREYAKKAWDMRQSEADSVKTAEAPEPGKPAPVRMSARAKRKDYFEGDANDEQGTVDGLDGANNGTGPSSKRLKAQAKKDVLDEDSSSESESEDDDPLERFFSPSGSEPIPASSPRRSREPSRPSPLVPDTSLQRMPSPRTQDQNAADRIEAYMVSAKNEMRATDKAFKSQTRTRQDKQQHYEDLSKSLTDILLYLDGGFDLESGWAVANKARTHHIKKMQSKLEELNAVKVLLDAQVRSGRNEQEEDSMRIAYATDWDEVVKVKAASP